MDSILSRIDVELLQKQALKMYNHKYFQYIVLSVSISLAFLFGRLLHQKKFSNLLNMINDVQTTRKKILNEKQQTQKSVRSIQSKKYILLSLLFIVIVSLSIYVYFMKKVDYNLLVYVGTTLFTLIIIIWIYLKYLKWKKHSLQTKLKQSQLTTQNEIKQILSSIGPQIQKSIKFKLQRQIEDNIRKQQQKQCLLNKCANQKRTYEKLYSLYKNIIGEMTKFAWCTVCASQSNINTIDLGIQQLDANLVLYRKLAKDQKFLANVQKTKQLINKMLQEWSNLQPKLEYVCKRGCCIKFRELIDGLKKEHFRSLNDLKSSLR